jgi:hypothetical protein
MCSTSGFSLPNVSTALAVPALSKLAKGVLLGISSHPAPAGVRTMFWLAPPDLIVRVPEESHSVIAGESANNCTHPLPVGFRMTFLSLPPAATDRAPEDALMVAEGEASGKISLPAPLRIGCTLAPATPAMKQSEIRMAFFTASYP